MRKQEVFLLKSSTIRTITRQSTLTVFSWKRDFSPTFEMTSNNPVVIYSENAVL
ncbi:MAG: hypothetical protein AAGJ12_06040 [Bacteroidota bacterium]